MSIYLAKPGFGAKKNLPSYYEAVNSIVKQLRPTATQKAIAEALSAAGLQTPSGKEFTKQRVAAYLRSAAI